MARHLSNYEQETSINFNKEEELAYIFTYERSWQKHLEGKLGLRPVIDNGFGGREYHLVKKLIRPPRIPRKSRPLSAEQKKRLSSILAEGRKKRVAQ